MSQYWVQFSAQAPNKYQVKCELFLVMLKHFFKKSQTRYYPNDNYGYVSFLYYVIAKWFFFFKEEK